MLLALALLVAEGDQTGQQPWWGMLIWILPMVVVFYLFVIRPARRQDAQRQSLVNAPDESHLPMNKGSRHFGCDYSMRP